ncbi:MAG: hypothetical protein KKF10_01550 [Verrucomicrobia bacterium]|nr:hypothetical protein [Verrucomicrobiota bacterium]
MNTNRRSVTPLTRFSATGEYACGMNFPSPRRGEAPTSDYAPPKLGQGLPKLGQGASASGLSLRTA